MQTIFISGFCKVAFLKIVPFRKYFRLFLALKGMFPALIECIIWDKCQCFPVSPPVNTRVKVLDQVYWLWHSNISVYSLFPLLFRVRTEMLPRKGPVPSCFIVKIFWLKGEKVLNVWWNVDCTLSQTHCSMFPPNKMEYAVII